jgi:hypothetical protein
MGSATRLRDMQARMVMDSLEGESITAPCMKSRRVNDHRGAFDVAFVISVTPNAC